MRAAVRIVLTILLLGLLGRPAPAFAGEIFLEDDQAMVAADGDLTLDLAENDFVDSAPGHYALSSDPSLGTATVTDAGSLSYHSTGAAGEDQFSYEVTDADGDTSTAFVTVTVTKSITSPGPLTSVSVDEDLNCAVNHVDDAQGEFYSDTACGTFLVVDDTVYSPALIPAGSPATPWTPVSQSPLAGNGTAGSPFRYTTVVDAGTSGVRVEQTDSYVVGQESYRTDIKILNSGPARDVRVYRAADCFLADSDSGKGAVDTATGAVACVSPESQRVEQWLPLSSGSHYYEARFDEVWDFINTKAAFPDTCRCDEEIDNGAGLSWDVPLAAGGSATRSSLITFSPDGAVPLNLTKTVDDTTVPTGDTVRYTITVHNPGGTAAAVTTITDDLPPGFQYVAGSTAGATTDNPVEANGTLTWSAPVSVPAGGQQTLSFDAVVASTTGTYFNTAEGTAEGLFVTGTGQTAPVEVVPAADTTAPSPVSDLTAIPGDEQVALSWTNPTDADFAKVRLFYREGTTAPTGPDDGTEVTLSGPTADSATVTGLLNGVDYTFAVFAYDESGNVSDPASVTAQPVAPGQVAPVQNLQAAGAGSGKVVLTWENPAELDGIVVVYSTDQQPQTPEEGTSVPVTGTPQTVTISGLDDTQTYFFSVFAKLGTKVSDPAFVTLQPFACPDLSTALDAPAGLVTGSSWVACSAPDANSNDNTLSTKLPRTGAAQALMTTGDRAVAAPPSKGSGEGRDNGTGSRGAQDVSIYKLDLSVPAGSQCLSFDYAFASEEYPEFVGQSFNDGFLAQLDQNEWTVDADSAIQATGNFAKLSDGSYVSVNSPVFAEGATIYTDETNGTAYDGMSGALRASTPITAGAHSIYLSIFDAGDGIYDSAAFIDHLLVSNAACSAGSTPANQPPHAVADSATTTANTPVTTQVLGNDTDADGDTLSVTSPAPTATHGTVSCTALSCTYTPATGYTGSDSYTYTVSDGHGGSDTGTVNVTVNNRAPVANDDTAVTTGTAPKSVPVLANDTDPDGHALSVTSAAPTAAHGTVSCTATACTYTASSGYRGTDAFVYAISDGHGGTDTGTVTMTVNAAPHAVTDSATTNANTAVVTPVLGNDTDADGDTLTVTSAAPTATHGTVSCTALSCTYTPATGYTGSDSYAYTVSDGHGGSDTGTVNVTVNNRAPVANNDSAATTTTTPKLVSVLGNDTDPDGHALTVTSASPTAAHGTVSCTATACTYTANSGYTGQDSFTYTVSDSHGGSDDGNVTMTVNAAVVNARSVSIATSATSRVWPQQVTVSGVVRKANGTVAPGVTVELWAKPAGSAYGLIATKVSAANGSVSSVHRPSTGTTYQWRVPGTTPAVASAQKAVSVAPMLTAAANARALATGADYVISGVSSPARAGAPVLLQRRGSRGWVTVMSSTFTTESTSTTTGAAYSFTIRHTSSKVNRYRVVVPADSGRLQRISGELRVTVYRARITGVHATGDEYVTVKNTGTMTVNLAGWKLRNAAGVTRTLGTRLVAAGASLRIHSGSGRNNTSNLYLGRSAMWGNSHDTATLFDARAFKLSELTY